MTTPSGHTSAIRAEKVIGTSVKDAAGNRIGEVKDIVLDKQSNNIMFTVLSFGGFLGMGDKYHPIPWSMLKYDTVDGNYVIDVTKEQLTAAPSDSLERLTREDGMAFRNASFDYYQAPRYW